MELELVRGADVVVVVLLRFLGLLGLVVVWFVAPCR